MMGRTTLREVREALAAARSGQAKPPSASPTVDELESLVRLLEAGASETPAAPDGGGHGQGAARRAEPREVKGSG
jgi:hypothetical protein